jgi:hypothetical protein
VTGGVGARREGDRYQDLYGWFRALELLRPARKVWRVSVEDPTAGSFDDVTIRPEPGTSHRPEFAQVKFHVDLAGAYSSSGLMEARSRNGKSLLEKAWESWLTLRDENADAQLLFITTWAWDPKDPLARHLRRGPLLTSDFVQGTVSGTAKRVRDEWRCHLATPDEATFQAFLGSMQFRLGYPATAELREWTAERMELVGLKHDEDAVRSGAEQIWQWIADGKHTITKGDMLGAIAAHDLADAPAESAVSLYVHTILKEPAETDGDYELDWRGQFEGDEWVRGHHVRDPGCWNDVMLPGLIDTRAKISRDTGCRLLRVRGKARLSAWFAIGHVFSPVAGWTLEVEQGGNRWRNDTPIAEDIAAVVQPLEVRGVDSETLAVGVSVTGDLSGDVRAYLAKSGEPAGTLLLIGINRTMDRAALRSAADATALASHVRAAIRDALGRRARRVLLFYFGPLAGAAFLGAALNAVAGEVLLFEDQEPGYAPSFLLS